MTTAGLSELLASARAERRGLGAFNVILLEHAEAIVAGAEAAGAPVVLQLSQNTVRYHGGLAPIGAGCLAIARAAQVPVVVHLDHATEAGLVDEALALGLRSVMFDASRLDYGANLAATAQVVARAHRVGAAVEAELGEVGGKDGVHAPGARTDPDQARQFVAATGVDALAVAVGTSHAKLVRDLAVDHDLIRRLAAAVDCPLVLHGSSSLPDDELRRGIASGLTKINIATHLNVQFTAGVRSVLADPGVVDPRRYISAGRDAVAQETRRLLVEVLGSAGR
jgi:ketose-bisphosphate aldolase